MGVPFTGVRNTIPRPDFAESRRAMTQSRFAPQFPSAPRTFAKLPGLSSILELQISYRHLFSSHRCLFSLRHHELALFGGLLRRRILTMLSGVCGLFLWPQSGARNPTPFRLSVTGWKKLRKSSLSNGPKPRNKHAGEVRSKRILVTIVGDTGSDPRFADQPHLHDLSEHYVAKDREEKDWPIKQR